MALSAPGVVPKPAMFKQLLFVATASLAGAKVNLTLPAVLEQSQGITAACAASLMTEVSCDPVLQSMQNGYYYPPDTLRRVCTGTCQESLTAYRQGVNEACSGGNQSVPGFSDDFQMSPLAIPDVYGYFWDYYCLSEGDRWCNQVAAELAVMADPGGKLVSDLLLPRSRELLANKAAAYSSTASPKVDRIAG